MNPTPEDSGLPCASRGSRRPPRQPLAPAISRRLALLALLAITNLSAGCAHSYLHNPTREKQAEATTKAWAELAPDGLLSTERDNLKKLLQAEQETQLRLAAARRQYLATVIVAPAREGEGLKASPLKATVVDPARQALVALVGPISAFDAQAFQLAQTAGMREDVAAAGLRLLALGSPVFDCTTRGDQAPLPGSATAWLSSLDIRPLTAANDDLRTLLNQCKRLRQSGAPAVDPAAPAGTVLHAAQAQLQRDRQALTDLAAAFKAAKKAYDAALGDDATPTKADDAAPDSPALAAQLAAKAKAVQNAITALRSLNNALANQFVADETLDAIDTALSAIATGDPGLDQRKGVILAAQAPAIIDRYRDAIAKSQKPLALPLLIRRNAEQLQGDAAAKDLQLLQAKVKVSEQIVQAVHDQATALRKALRELDAACRLPAPAAADKPQPVAVDCQLTWSDAQAAATGEAKRLLLSGTARYLDAVTRLEGERYRLAYAHIALDHERGLAYSEASVGQWANLIGAGVGQLDDFAKGGVNGAVLSDLAKVIGLFGIVRGVNQ